MFRGGTDGYGLWVNANWPSFKAKWEEWNGQGLRLLDLEVTDPANTANSPTMSATVAMASGIESDENGGEGYGGIFGGDHADLIGSTSDIDTGSHMPGTAQTSSATATANGGLGAMSAGGPVAIGPGPANIGSMGYAGNGPGDASAPEARSGSDDGFGSIGGAGLGMADLDTGGIGGMG